MTFQDILGIGTFVVTIVWMCIAYGLFVLQAQTFKSQLEIQKLDYQRYMDELLPDFKFTFEHNLDLVSGKVYVEILNNSVLDLYIKGNSYDLLHTHGELQTPRDVNGGATAEFSYSLSAGRSKEDFWNIFGAMYGPILRFEIFFTDRKSFNKYQQTLDYYYETEKTKLHVPIIISKRTKTIL
ncbi:MAG: hypothetical protein ABI367_07945 [Mucilaginibacter sp.]